MKRNVISKVHAQSEVAPEIYFLLLLLVIALPLIALPYIVEDVFDLPKATVLRVVSLSIAGLWLIRSLARGRFEWRRTSLDFPILVFSAIAVLATLFSYSPAASLMSAVYKRHETLPTWLAYFLVFFAASNFLREPGKVLNVLRAVVFASAIVSLYGILQHFGYDPISFQVSNVDRFRSFSTFGNAVFLGGYLVLIVPLALSLFFAEESPKLKALWMTVLFLNLITLVFTYTRGAWVGGGLALVIWLGLAVSRGRVHSKDRRKWVAVLTAVLVFAVLVVLLAEMLFPIDISLKERIVSAFELKGSVASRLSIWRTTVKAISLRPWLGWGPETQRLVSPPLRERLFVELEGPSKIADRPHNQILHITSSFGLLGLLAYLWVMVSFLSFSFSRLSKTKDLNFFLSSGIVAGSLGYLVQEQFAFSVIGVTPLLWMLLGANFGLLGKPNDLDIKLVSPPALRYSAVFLVVVVAMVGVFFSLRLAAADFYYQGAIRAARAGSQDKSLEFFRRAATLNPWEVRYMFAFGEKAKNVALNNRQQLYLLDEAISAYNRGLARYPTDYDLYFGLGNVYFVKAFLTGGNGYKEAGRAYAKAVRFEPYFVEAYVWLGKTYLAEGDLQVAIKNLGKAFSISPRNIAVLDGLAQVYARRGDTERAVSYLEQILAIDPYYSPAIQELKRLTGAAVR